MTWTVRNMLQITFTSWLTLVKLSWRKLLCSYVLCCICLFTYDIVCNTELLIGWNGVVVSTFCQANIYVKMLALKPNKLSWFPQFSLLIKYTIVMLVSSESFPRPLLLFEVKVSIGWLPPYVLACLLCAWTIYLVVSMA